MIHSRINYVSVVHNFSRGDAFNVCNKTDSTGDGAGILLALPHEFFKEEAKKLKINLPEKGNYAVGNIFFPQKRSEKDFCKKTIEDVLKREKLELLGWRQVPIDSKKADVGPAALDCKPGIEQIFINAPKNTDQNDFERKLYLVRKIFTKKLSCLLYTSPSPRD